MTRAQPCASWLCWLGGGARVKASPPATGLGCCGKLCQRAPRLAACGSRVEYKYIVCVCVALLKKVLCGNERQPVSPIQLLPEWYCTGSKPGVRSFVCSLACCVEFVMRRHNWARGNMLRERRHYSHSTEPDARPASPASRALQNMSKHEQRRTPHKSHETRHVPIKVFASPSAPPPSFPKLHHCTVLCVLSRRKEAAQMGELGWSGAIKHVARPFALKTMCRLCCVVHICIPSHSSDAIQRYTRICIPFTRFPPSKLPALRRLGVDGDASEKADTFGWNGARAARLGWSIFHRGEANCPTANASI